MTELSDDAMTRPLFVEPTPEMRGHLYSAQGRDSLVEQILIHNKEF